jgi:hypothetical protein
MFRVMFGIMLSFSRHHLISSRALFSLSKIPALQNTRPPDPLFAPISTGMLILLRLFL